MTIKFKPPSRDQIKRKFETRNSRWLKRALLECAEQGHWAAVEEIAVVLQALRAKGIPDFLAVCKYVKYYAD